MPIRALNELDSFAADAIRGDTVSFISWYRDGGLLTINPQFERLAGYRKDELERMRWPDDFMPEDAAGRINKSMDRLDRGQESREHDAVLLGKDGARADVIVNVNKYSPASGEEPFYYSFITDVTERNRERMALQEAKAQAELYVDLMGHDIHNMNQVAAGYLEMALGTAKLSPGERELIMTALGSLMNASRIIDNVKRVQREKAGLYQLQTLDLDGIIRHAIGRFQEVPGRDVKISYRPRKCMVRGNELLNDVFINLIGNAIKHSSGPVTIGIKLGAAWADGRRFCRVAVEDDGPGIPDEAKQKLLSETCLARARLAGKGFGLCLTRMIVEDLGGRLLAEDRVPGDHTRGVRFIVMLPAVPGPGDEYEARASA